MLGGAAHAHGLQHHLRRIISSTFQAGGFGDGPLLNTWSGASWSPYVAGVGGGRGSSGATAEHVAWALCGYSCEVTGT